MESGEDSRFKLQLLVCSAMSLPRDVITLSVALQTSLEEVKNMVLERLKENDPGELISVELKSSPKLDDTCEDDTGVPRLLKKDVVKATVIYLTQSQHQFDHKLKFSVTMAERHVRSIEKEQFQDCKPLANITSSDCFTYLEEIDDYAFYNCSALKSFQNNWTFCFSVLHLFGEHHFGRLRDAHWATCLSRLHGVEEHHFGWFP